MGGGVGGMGGGMPMGGGAAASGAGAGGGMDIFGMLGGLMGGGQGQGQGKMDPNKLFNSAVSNYTYGIVNMGQGRDETPVQPPALPKLPPPLYQPDTWRG